MSTTQPKVKLVQFQELQLLKDIELNGGKYQKGGFLSVWNAKSDFYGTAASPLRAAFIHHRDRFLRLTLKNYIQELINKGIPISDSTYQKALEKNLLTGGFGEAVNNLYDLSGKKQEAEAPKSDRKSDRKANLSSSSSNEDSSSDEEESDAATQLSKSIASLSFTSSGKKSANNPPTPIKQRQPRSSAPPSIPTQVSHKKFENMSGEEGDSGGKCVSRCCGLSTNNCFHLTLAELLWQAHQVASHPR